MDGGINFDAAQAYNVFQNPQKVQQQKALSTPTKECIELASTVQKGKNYKIDTPKMPTPQFSRMKKRQVPMNHYLNELLTSIQKLRSTSARNATSESNVIAGLQKSSHADAEQEGVLQKEALQQYEKIKGAQHWFGNLVGEIAGWIAGKGAKVAAEGEKLINPGLHFIGLTELPSLPSSDKVSATVESHVESPINKFTDFNVTNWALKEIGVDPDSKLGKAIKVGVAVVATGVIVTGAVVAALGMMVVGGLVTVATGGVAAGLVAGVGTFAMGAMLTALPAFGAVLAASIGLTLSVWSATGALKVVCDKIFQGASTVDNVVTHHHIDKDKQERYSMILQTAITVGGAVTAGVIGLASAAGFGLVGGLIGVGSAPLFLQIVGVTIGSGMAFEGVISGYESYHSGMLGFKKIIPAEKAKARLEKTIDLVQATLKDTMVFSKVSQKSMKGLGKKISSSVYVINNIFQSLDAMTHNLGSIGS
ncbi:MAG: hypothetical protein ACQEP8_00440 [Chlamydiota bacterium]